MKIPVPNPYYSYCTAEVLLDNGQQHKITSGGGNYIEIDDNAVEALCRSHDTDLPDCTHAWTKEDGVQTLALYLQAKKLREKIAAYEERQRQQARAPKKVVHEKVQNTASFEGAAAPSDVSQEKRGNVRN